MPKTKEEKAAYKKEYYAKNKEKLAADKKVYRVKNKETAAAYHKEYYTKNKEKLAAYHKEYRAKNKETAAVYGKEYRAKNKETMLADKREYAKTPLGVKSRKMGGWKSLGIIYDFDKLHHIYINTTKCWVCNNKFKSSRDKHVDHDHDINNGENFRFILCRRCNNYDYWKKQLAVKIIVSCYKKYLSKFY